MDCVNCLSFLISLTPVACNYDYGRAEIGIKIKNFNCNKEICKYLWALEEEKCSTRLLFVQKDSQKALFSAGNNRWIQKQLFALGYLVLIMSLGGKSLFVKNTT